MPPQVALILGYGLVGWLLWNDRQWRRSWTRALWIPAIWLTLLGSRPMSFWIGGGGSSNLEGSPVNVLCNGFLIASALVVLLRRGFDWGYFAERNKALLLIYFYFATSALWSEFPLSSIKRIINDFGCVLIALVILTDRNPGEAGKAVFVRVAYFLFPLSVVFIRYFPHIGRISSRSAEQMVTGVTGHKNSLGQLVFVLGLVILWEILEHRRHGGGPRTRMQRWSHWGIMAIGLYLLVICDSATSLVCFVAGGALLVLRERLTRMQNARRFVLISLTALACLWGLDRAFGISDKVLALLGRNATLTGRTDIWQEVREAKINVVVGSGFRGFWETDAGVAIYEKLNINRLFTAHNGYLDVYMSGGLVGVALLGLALLSGGTKALNKYFSAGTFGKVALPYWVIAILYNNSESNFFILEPLWFTWLLVTIECRGPALAFAPALDHAAVEGTGGDDADQEIRDNAAPEAAARGPVGGKSGPSFLTS